MIKKSEIKILQNRIQVTSKLNTMSSNLCEEETGIVFYNIS